jgi:signal transduction histidine kinase
MADADSIVVSAPDDPTPGLRAPVASNRPQLVLLQALVMIVLSYQLLFSRGALLAFEVQQMVVLGLMVVTAGLMFLPARLWAITWVVGSVVLFDTAVTTYILYLSGNAGSDLFLIYFLILLIAGFTSTFKQMIALSVILCAAYGASLYFLSERTGSLLEGHLLRIPVLLILATFYGVTAEAARKERHQKAGLLETIAALKRSEEERERLIRELQEALASIKTLSGLLPICASCKKIRDDKGYWNQIETYIRAHSDAKFTHGICPECVKKLYPELSQENKQL